MEFLAIFLPLALLLNVAGVALHFADRRLVRLVRARYPAILEALRGRPRRWYDGPEELWVQDRRVRRRFRDLLAPLAARDPELAATLTRIDARERTFRVSVRVGVALTVVIVIALMAWYRLVPPAGGELR